MEESTRQKPRTFPGMFSCSSRTLSDVVDKSILLHKSSSFHRFPSMCRPVTPLEPTSRSGPMPIPKVPEDWNPAAGFSFTLADVLKGRVYPTAPTVSPLNHPFRKLDSKKNHSKGQPAVQGSQWYSTDDEREELQEEEEEEDETDTIFSSRSLSFSSSDSSGQRQSPRRRRRSRNLPKVAVLPMDNDDDVPSIKGSFAVVKKSSDPYGDFRRSMVEMIVEKQMFGAKELERLLHCFLSLNSHHHHRVIVEVFAEIWEALFPHWS